MAGRIRNIVLTALSLFSLGGSASAERSSAIDAELAAPLSQFQSPRRSGLAPAIGQAPHWPDPWPARIAARLHELRGPARATTHETPQAHALRAALHPIVAAFEASRGAAHGDEADIAISVRSLATGEILFDLHGDRALNPASNHKLLTAVAAVELLGADYRFETSVARDGDTLHLVGRGDPSLQFEHLRALAADLRDRGMLEGIRQIAFDDTAFTEERFAPGYDPEGPGYSYMAPSGALSLQFNTIEITVSGGDAPTVSVNPPCEHVVIDNRAKFGRRSRLDVSTHREGDRTVVRVRGTMRKRGAAQRWRRRVASPGHFTASAFATALAEVGAPPLQVVRAPVPASAVPLAVHRSAPLAEVLESALKFSNNFTTEQVLRTLGHHLSGRPGDWDNGAAALQRFWSAIEPSEPTLAFENASGLSPHGRITARGLVDVLALLHADGPSRRLLDAMPLSGRDGTLYDRLTPVRDRVRAKTGTMSGASALSGFVVDPAGAPIAAFSILVNGEITGARARAIEDRIVVALVEQLDAEPQLGDRRLASGPGPRFGADRSQPSEGLPAPGLFGTTIP